MFEVTVGRALLSTSHQPSLEMLVGITGLVFALIDNVFMTLVWQHEMQKLRSISGVVQANCAEFVQMVEAVLPKPEPAKHSVHKKSP